MNAVRLCTCVLSAAIGAGLFPHTIDTAAAELPAINDIARRYGESVGRLQKWWVRYETEAKSTVRLEDREPGTRNVRSESEWAVDGKRSLLRTVTLPARDDLRFVCSDGRTTWSHGGPAQGGREAVVWKRPFREEDVAAFLDGHSDRVHPFLSHLGIALPYHGHSLGTRDLASLLAEGGKVVGFEEVHGTPCVHVEFAPRRVAEDTWDAWVEVWFDPGSGWLPRKIVFSSNAFEDGQRRSSGVREINSFLRIEQESGTVWFPEHLTHTAESEISSHRTVWRVLEHRINQPLEGALFRPPVPAGVPIIPLSERSRRRLERARMPADRVVEAPAPTLADAAANKAVVDASPPRGSWLPYWLVGAAVVLGLGALWLYKR